MKRIDFDLRFECMKVNVNYLHMVSTDTVMRGGILVSTNAILFYSVTGIDKYNINYAIMGYTNVC